MRCRLNWLNWLSAAVLMLCCAFAAVPVRAVTLVDIYGPGQNMVNMALASPLTGPGKAATGLGRELGAAMEGNLGFLPFMRLTPPAAVLGGTVLDAWQGFRPRRPVRHHRASRP